MAGDEDQGTGSMPDPILPISRRDFVQMTAGAAGALSISAILPGCGDRDQSTEGSGLGDRFQYDISKLAQTDPRLVGYRPHTVLIDHYDMQRGINLHVDANGTIWVLQQQCISKQIQQIHSNGTLANYLAIPVYGLAFVILADRTVCTASKSQVTMHDKSGEVLARWSIEKGSPHLTALAVHNNHVFITDAGNRTLWHYDREGKLINQVDGFHIPSPFFDCVLDPNEDLLWVAHTGKHRLEAYDFKLRKQQQWGVASMGIKGFCGCCNPVHFAMLADGRFITAEKGLPRVKRYSRTGEFECVVAGCEAFDVDANALKVSTPASLRGGPLVAVDTDQRVLVLNPVNGELVAYREKSDA